MSASPVLETRNSVAVTHQDLLDKIIQSSPVPIFVIDREHRVTHWNRACEVVLHYPAAKMIGSLYPIPRRGFGSAALMYSAISTTCDTVPPSVPPESSIMF